MIDYNRWKSPICGIRYMTDIRVATFVLLTILWRLWDARNAEVFRGERPSAAQIINHVIDDLHIWEKRFIIIKKKKKCWMATR